MARSLSFGASASSLAIAWFEQNTLSLLSVDRIHPERMWATVDGPFRPSLHAEGPLCIQLGAEHLPRVRARVEAREDQLESCRLELKLLDLDLDTGLTLAAFARLLARIDVDSKHHEPYRETLNGEHDVRGAMRFLVETQAQGAVQHAASTGSLKALEFDSSSGSVTWRFEGTPPRAPFLITANGYNSVYRIPVQRCEHQADRLVTYPPPWLQCVRYRRTRRVAAEGLRIAFDHPCWPSLRVERAMIDLTFDGLSFEAETERDPVYPGLETAHLFVASADGASIELRASVKSYRGFEDGVWGFGCSVEPVTRGDAARWQKLCEGNLFPTTRRGAAEVWSVYRESGYFGLSDTLDGEFEHLRAAHVIASQALATAPHLGCQSTWPARGVPRATVTNLKLYPSCWFSYHLAAQPDQAMATRSGEVLRDLYRQYVEHCLSSGDRWQLAYVQHSAHWSMRMHVDIPRQYEAQGQALVCDFRAIEVRSAAKARKLTDTALSVTTASDSEIKQSMEILQARLHPIYFDALAYHPDQFALGELTRDWARHGLERDRDMLIAYERGQPIAVAVVEAAQQGLHLFGLLDTLRMYTLSAPGQRAFSSLVDAAREWFRQRGRRTFCYLEEEGDIATNGRDIKLLSGAYLALLSLDRLPEMLERLYSDTARA